MTKAELISQAKDLGIDVSDKLTKAELEKVLSDVTGSMEDKPAEALKVHDKKKSKYENHPKFAKFKLKEGQKND